MKNQYVKLLAILFIPLLWMSCEDDESNLPVVREMQAPVLSLLNNVNVNINDGNLSQGVAPFSWSAANFNVNVPVQYTLQVAVSGTDFANVIDASQTTELALSLTGEELNMAMMQLGIFPGITATMDVRVKALAQTVNNTSTGEPSYSNVIQLNVTSFNAMPPTSPTLYVATQFPDASWNYSMAPKLCSPDDNGVYTGFAYLNAEDEHYFVSGNATTFVYYGMGAIDGVMQSEGGAIIPSESGYYQVTVNTNTLTYSFESIQWGIIGSATPDGWGADTDLAFDMETGFWKGEIAMVSGEFKFRANDDWAINYGPGSADGLLAPGTSNNLTFALPDGTYTFYLDFSDGCCPKYAIANINGDMEVNFGECEDSSGGGGSGVDQLYMVGAIQEHYGSGQWDPTNAIAMYKNEGLAIPGWEGYIKVNAGQNMKFVGLQGSWDEVNGANVNFGSEGGDTNVTSGTLIADGGSGAITLDEGGFYYVFIPLDLSSYQFVKTQWGIIGAATPGGWGDETDMTYDATSNSWKIDVDLVDGEMKFRSRIIGNTTGNHNGGGADWSYNIGTDASPHAADQGDGNFSVTAGSYSVELSFDPQGNATISGL